MAISAITCRQWRRLRLRPRLRLRLRLEPKVGEKVG
jgi:hypothetical protein